jgi:hypothetical protein
MEMELVPDSNAPLETPSPSAGNRCDCWARVDSGVIRCQAQGHIKRRSRYVADYASKPGIAPTEYRQWCRDGSVLATQSSKLREELFGTLRDVQGPWAHVGYTDLLDDYDSVSS